MSSNIDILTSGIKISDIYFEQQIYRNESGKVEIHLGSVGPQRLKVAVKITYCTSSEEFNNVMREALTMCQLNHPNICKVYTTLLDSRDGRLNNLLVMEKCEGGDLAKEIETRSTILNFWSEVELFSTFKNLIEAFSLMQSRNIVHSDIKPPNLAFTPEKIIKIIDFGISLHDNFELFKETTRTFKVGGTVPYFSPLQLDAYMGYIRGSNPSATVRHNPFKSDVFGLGLTFLHMASLKQPIGLNDNNNDLPHRIEVSIASVPYTDRIKFILSTMLTINETNRPDFLQLSDIIKKI